jgi:hypothetical protein
LYQDKRRERKMKIMINNLGWLAAPNPAGFGGTLRNDEQNKG